MPIITQRRFNQLLKIPRPKPLNVCRCETCGKILWSSHRHDWVACECEQESGTEIFLDGGDDYCRWGYGKDARISWWDSVNQKWKPQEFCSSAKA